MVGETILVTDGQLRSALAVVRSLGRRGKRIVCGESTRFATACFSRYVDETFVYPPPDERPQAFVERLRAVIAARDVDVLLPVGHETTRLVSEHRAEFVDEVRLAVPPFDRFERGFDKAKTFEAAAAAGVPRPETRCPTSASAAVDAADAVGYPLVVKARTSAGSRGLSFVDDRESFEELYERVDARYPAPLVQERVPQEGAMLGAAFLYDETGTARAEFACEFVREFPPSGGPSTLHRSIDGEAVRRHGRALLDEMDWRGIALVEFKVDPRDGQPKLMEMNPRFWSSLHLPLLAGVDFPWLVYRYAMGEDLPEPPTYEEDVYARNLLPGDLLRLAAVRDAEALREFFPLRRDGLHYEIASWDDVGPVFGRLSAMARYAFSPRMWQKAVVRS